MSGDNHLLQIDVMKKVAAVRVVEDCCHGEPGMQSNQGDELKRKVMNSLGMGVGMNEVPRILGSCRQAFGRIPGSIQCDAGCAARRRQQRMSTRREPISAPCNNCGRNLD